MRMVRSCLLIGALALGVAVAGCQGGPGIAPADPFLLRTPTIPPPGALDPTLPSPLDPLPSTAPVPGAPPPGYSAIPRLDSEPARFAEPAGSEIQLTSGTQANEDSSSLQFASPSGADGWSESGRSSDAGSISQLQFNEPVAGSQARFRDEAPTSPSEVVTATVQDVQSELRFAPGGVAEPVAPVPPTTVLAQAVTAPVQAALSDPAVSQALSQYRQLAAAAEGYAQQGANYGYGPQYGWLMGRLEFSSVENAWFIRYLPQAWPQDEFEGRLRLPASSVEEHFQAGEFVAVEGTIEAATHEGDSVPFYRVTRIKPLFE